MTALAKSAASSESVGREAEATTSGARQAPLAQVAVTPQAVVVRTVSTEGTRLIETE